MRARSFFGTGLLGLLLICADSGSSALARSAEAPRHLRIDDYFALKSINDPRISPDGAWVAYVIETKDLEKDQSETRLWMVSTSGGEAIPLTAKGSSAASPRWRPDRKYLSFLAERQWDQGSEIQGRQVFTLDRRGGEGVRLTSVKQGVEDFEWSPDGKRLVLVIRDSSEEKSSGP